MTNRLLLWLVLFVTGACFVPVSGAFFIGPTLLSLLYGYTYLCSKTQLVIDYLDHGKKEWVTEKEVTIYSWYTHMVLERDLPETRIVDVIVGETISFWIEENEEIKRIDLPRDTCEVIFKPAQEGIPSVVYQAEQYVEFGFFDLLERTKLLSVAEKRQWPQQHRFIIYTDSISFLPIKENKHSQVKNKEYTKKLKRGKK
ncbi:hypothetical protein C240_919 [Enterococcus sp. 5H]|nr:hypothetical protein [Enterococcus sp. 5H]